MNLLDIVSHIRIAPYKRCAIAEDGRRMCGTCLGSARKGLSSSDFDFLVRTHAPARRAVEFYQEVAP